MKYWRILKVTGAVTFGISNPKGPQFSGSRDLQTVKVHVQYMSNPFHETQ